MGTGSGYSRIPYIPSLNSRAALFTILSLCKSFSVTAFLVSSPGFRVVRRCREQSSHDHRLLPLDKCSIYFNPSFILLSKHNSLDVDAGQMDVFWGKGTWLHYLLHLTKTLYDQRASNHATHLSNGDLGCLPHGNIEVACSFSEH